MGFNVVATAASGVEGVLKKEIERLGYGVNPAVYGAVSFHGDELAVARANLFLRTAERVYIELGVFPARTFDELFAGVFSLALEEWMPADAKIVVNGKCLKSDLFAISACQKIVKKAIVERLKKAHGVLAAPETGEEFDVEFRLIENRAHLLLNTSGEGLHKRGYRDYVGRAPIRETLASAMLLLSDFYFDKPFADPFCGSGTIVIEAAEIALNLAAGRNRRFAFENWSAFDEKALRLAKEEAAAKERRHFTLDFYGGDVDKKAIALSRRHAERAGLADKIRLEVANVKDFSSKERFGTIVTNPPYGERLGEKDEIRSLYKELGKRFRALSDWSLYAITSDTGFTGAFGAKPDKTRKLFNAEKECRFFEFRRKTRYFRNRKEYRDD